MNCNYDCDESLSLNSNDCLMKDVTVLICSGIGIFVSFSSWFNSRNVESIGIKCLDYWYFSCIKEKMKFIFQDIANHT